MTEINDEESCYNKSINLGYEDDFDHNYKKLKNHKRSRLDTNLLFNSLHSELNSIKTHKT